MPIPVNARVEKHRNTLRSAGLRPVQIWVPDTRRPGFAEECQRQARAVAKTDAADIGLDSFIDAALSDIVGEEN